MLDVRLNTVRDGAGASGTVRETVREGRPFPLWGRWRITAHPCSRPRRATVNVVPPPHVSELADSKLLMTNPSHEPEEQRPEKPVRIILPKEVCTDPETAAKLLYGEVQKALKTLRGGSGSTPSDTPRADAEG